MITALLVDDEAHNRNILRTLIDNHCPNLHIVGESASAEDAFVKINTLQPKLVFLDIRMPKKTGFDLLKMFDETNFEVIFVTAFDKYAIRAFEFNALGYILKPVDLSKLIAVVKKAEERIHNETDKNLALHFVKTLSETNGLVNKFSLHHNGKVVFLNIDEVSSIEANEENTTLTMCDKSHYYSSKRLLQFEAMLEEAENFIRISRSVILNIDYLQSYSKNDPCTIDMKTGHAFEVSRRRKGEILKVLKGL